MFFNNLTLLKVGVAGFEPATPWSQTRCASRTALYPDNISISSFFQVVELVTLPIQSGCASRKTRTR